VSVRDAQRARLYEAEDLVAVQLDRAAAGGGTITLHHSTVTIPLEIRFGSLAAAEDYCRRVQRTGWFTERWPEAAAVPVVVRQRRGGQGAHYETGGRIALHEPRHGTGWALRELVVLHELAHHVVDHTFDQVAPHGPQYAGVLYDLVRHACGPEVGLLLMSAFGDLDVRWGVAAAARGPSTSGA
jgi:putative metallohydrolase (TIGR04338 family)